MQNEMKSSVTSRKNRYNASPFAAATALGETTSLDAYATKALLGVG